MTQPQRPGIRLGTHTIEPGCPRCVEVQSPVYTTIVGTNADLIHEVVRLYPLAGLAVADVTYGKGVFWHKVATTTFDFHPSDLMTGVDFRALPYGDATMDVVVLDPPYMHDAGCPQCNYNASTTRGMGHDAIVQLYAEGMGEARRVLRPGGQLWVKCQDEIVSGHQRRTSYELYTYALMLGFIDQDRFTLIRRSATVQVKRQHHARKNESCLWVFVKPNDAPRRRGAPS